jgi:hypothetical protein
MKTAPHPAPPGEACAPFLDWLDPAKARELVTRALPAFRAGQWTPLDVSAQRWDVRRGGRMVLTCAVRFRDATGSEDARPLLVEIGDGEPRLSLSPADPAFPGLPERLETVAATLGPGKLRVLAHRFGRRLTLRWTPERGRAAGEADPAGRGFIVKIYARGEDGRATVMLRALRRASLPFRTPDLAAHRPEPGLVVQTIVPGASVHDILPSGSAIPAETLGRAILAVREANLNGALLRPHGMADELAGVDKLAGRVAVAEPELADELRSATADFAAAVADARGDGADHAPHVLAHRDLHDKQVLCEGPTIGLIDWDLAALAPPALDPGNFLAHLTLRTLQGRVLPDRAAATRRALLSGLGSPDGARMRDLHNWESVALLRLVGVYALRPAWPGVARRILAAFHDERKTA